MFKGRVVGLDPFQKNYREREVDALVHEYPGTSRHSGFPMAHGASEGRIGDPDARTVAWQTVPCPDAGNHAV